MQEECEASCASFFIVSWILGGYFEHVFEDEGVLPDLVTKWHLLTRAEEGHNNNNVRRNAKLKHAMVGKKAVSIRINNKEIENSDGYTTRRRND